LVGLGVVTSVLTARALGPAGRGELAIAAAITAIAVQFGNLGLHATNTWVVAREPDLLGRLLANSVFVSLVVGASIASAIAVLAAAAPSLVPVDGPLLIVALVGIPLGLATLLTGNLLIGTNRVRDYNVLELASRILSIGAVVAVIAIGLVSPLAFLVGGTAVAAILVGTSVLILKRHASAPTRPHLSLLRRHWQFGLKAYVLALFSFLIIRADLFLVEAYLGDAAVGQYSIAVALIDLIYALPVVIASLLFPRLSRMSEPADAAPYTSMIAVRVAAVMTGGAIIAALAAEPAIRMLYGIEFADAAPAFVWLLPGMVCLAIHTIVMSYFASVGYPRPVLIALPAALAVNLVANLVLLPQFGIIGASAASTIAYAVMLAVSGSQFRSHYRAARQAPRQDDPPA
jgi:O-antigen/teichoic acid export membrane protein